MQHKGTVQIETERLILRRFYLKDADCVFNNWGKDERVTKYLSWSPHKNVKETKKILRGWVKGYHNKKVYNWAIVLKDINQPIGSITVIEHKDKTDMVHIGYCIGFDWWHKGIMSETLAAVIKFFFEEVKVNRIETQHEPENPNSGKVMQKCGMIYEGTLRQKCWSNNGIVDACCYSILASDYFANK